MKHYECNECGYQFTVIIDVEPIRCQYHNCESTNTTELK